MEQIIEVLKSLTDPVFIIFAILVVAFAMWLFSAKKKADTLILLLGIVMLYGLSISPVANYLIYQLEKDYLHPPPKGGFGLDVIVVLSGGANDINPLEGSFCNDATMVRLMHAVQMYKRYGAKYLVCSGKSHSKIADAQLMVRLAVDWGVPKEKLRMDATSCNTYEHAKAFNQMFSDKNIRVGLVTSAYHMKRSEKAFKKFFRNTLPLPANYLYASPARNVVAGYIPQSKWLYQSAVAMHEYIGGLWYRVKERL